MPSPPTKHLNKTDKMILRRLIDTKLEKEPIGTQYSNKLPIIKTKLGL